MEREHAVNRVIELYGQNDQRSAAWHTKRTEMITASEVTDAWTTSESRRRLIMRKLEPKENVGTGACAPLIWGTRFEPIAKKIYEDETGCRIVDVSCVQHQTIPFLGASPDGIIFPKEEDKTDKRWGRLVEFKCPFSRDPKPEIPNHYIHQMQMQMECTGIDECEYVEFRFKQVYYAEWTAFEGKKGVFAAIGDGKVFYREDTQTTEDWKASLDGDADDYQFVYWILASTKKDFVPKDPEWLTTHLPDLQATWDEVVKHREAGTLPEAPPKPVVVTLDI